MGTLTTFLYLTLVLQSYRLSSGQTSHLLVFPVALSIIAFTLLLHLRHLFDDMALQWGGKPPLKGFDPPRCAQGGGGGFTKGGG